MTKLCFIIIISDKTVLYFTISDKTMLYITVSAKTVLYFTISDKTVLYFAISDVMEIAMHRVAHLVVYERWPSTYHITTV